MDSILTSIKKLLGIEEEYEHFDPNIVMCINSAFTVLTQLGVGPSNGFSISDKNSKWSDFVEDMSKIEAVKTYVHMRVRLLFDPPTNSSLIESINQTIDELEWRLNVAAENDDIYIPSSGDGIDYRTLSNLPSINGETLFDNYDEQDPTMVEMSTSELEDLWAEEDA